MSTGNVAIQDFSLKSRAFKFRLQGLDWWLVGTVLLLMGSGVLMILSASSLSADEVYGDALHFSLRQIAGIGLGGMLAIGVLFVPWRWLRRSSWWIYGLGIVGLILVFTPMGYRAYAATRWISLGGVNVQPSEFAKIGLVLVMAHYLAANEGRLADLTGVVVPAVALPVPILVLLMLEPDFGTTVITAALAGVMLFVAGLRWRYVLTLGGMAVGSLAFLALLAPYRVRRLVSFTDPFADSSGGGYQVIQGWIAMASGGWTGQGIATGVAKRGGLPEAHNDFISAVVGEELGAIGWLIMIALYLVLTWRGFAIAAGASDLFGAMVASALTTILACQEVINLGVVVGWMPAKGLVLPFMSYGASAVVAHLLCVGLLLRVGMESSERKRDSSIGLGGASA